MPTPWENGELEIVRRKGQIRPQEFRALVANDADLIDRRGGSEGVAVQLDGDESPTRVHLSNGRLRVIDPTPQSYGKIRQLALLLGAEVYAGGQPARQEDSYSGKSHSGPLLVTLVITLALLVVFYLR